MNTQQQDFEKLFRKELEAVDFELTPIEIKELSPIWAVILNVSSLYSLDCDVETLETIADSICVEETFSTTLYTASFLLNTITKLSPKDLDLTVFEYIRYCQMTKNISDRWNEMVLPIRDKLVNKMRTQEALHVPKNGLNVIPGKRR